MSYLFSFKGRINRAKMWLFILVTLAWEIAIGLVAVFGLSWTTYIQNLKAFTGADQTMSVPPLPWPNPVAGAGWIAVGVIALLILLYFVAMLAVYTKRLHDRNKNAWWLVPFVIIPWGMGIYQWLPEPNIFAIGPLMGPLGMGRGIAHLIGTLLGLWAFVELFFFRGTAGENRYGPNPLG